MNKRTETKRLSKRKKEKKSTQLGVGQKKKLWVVTKAVSQGYTQITTAF